MSLQLAVQQKIKGNTVAIFCLFHEGRLAEIAAQQAIPVTAFAKPPGFSLSTIVRMAGTMRRFKPDVVHTHNPFVHHYGTIAARLAGAAAVISTRHGPVSSDGVTYPERYFKWVD